MTEPNQWTVKKFANVGASEQFVREHLELFDLLNGTLILGKQREEARDAIGDILTDGLIPAFLELRSIRDSTGKSLPVIDSFQLYEDFARKLWKAYKDLTQRAAKAMGFEIGFLFQNEKIFEEGLKQFRNEHPSVVQQFEEYLRANRNDWQNGLAKFRNGFLEHQQGKRQDFIRYYQPVTAENLFFVTFRTIGDILVALMNLRLPPRICIVEHNPASDPAWPNRFRFFILPATEVSK